MRVPVFSDYVNNVEKEDADDLRFFISNAVQPIDADRGFCIDQMKQIRDNKACHPHLRWRAHQALKVIRVFGVMNHGEVTGAIFDYGKVKGLSLVRYTPSFFDKPASLSAVDHTICECAGHIISPQNPQKLKAILVVLQANPATEKKFTQFVCLATAAIETAMEESLPNIIEALGSVQMGKPRSESRPYRNFDSMSNVRVFQR